jgi:GTP cyclohydrolase IA
MSYSKDSEVGYKIRQHLVSKKVETPFSNKVPSQHKLEELMTEFMNQFGLDLTDDSLMETPKRVAKLYINEYFKGLDYTQFPKATVVENKMKVDEMIVERNIIVNSLCEHHLLPIVGSAFVAYIPNDKVLGLSKLNRIVDFFSRRPQIQERLTLQIYYALSYLLDTENVAVMIQAEHMCVRTRGVSDPCSDTITSKLGGSFKDGTVRAEFLTLSQGFKASK